MIDPSAVPLTLRPAMSAGIEREWARLGSTGTWWSGDERIAVSRVARAALDRQPRPATVLSDLVATTVERIATAPHHITRADVDELTTSDVDVEAYVELVGIVARSTAVDTTIRGIGADPLPFPEAAAGEPSRTRVPAAKRRSAFVPMVGAAGAITALSAVADEAAAQADLHGSLYLSYAEMGDFGIVKDVPRWQMELAASTTSWLNHCVY